MSEEKIREKPPVPPATEQAKEPSAPKTSQSAFDKVLEQQKILQQSPLAQGKIADDGGIEQKIKEITRWREHGEEKRREKERDETAFKEKGKSREKGSDTATREAVVRGGEKRGSGGGTSGGGDKGKGGLGGESSRRNVAEKRLSDIKGMLLDIGRSAFAGKLAQAVKASTLLTPQQMQGLVNKIVQSIRVGKDELGWPELKLILREHIFEGLGLRFTSKDGKVLIRFETTTKGVKDLFTAEAGRIKTALEEKGIAVEEIKVV